MDRESNRRPGSPGTRRDVPEGPIHSRVWKMVDVELGRFRKRCSRQVDKKGRRGGMAFVHLGRSRKKSETQTSAHDAGTPERLVSGFFSPHDSRKTPASSLHTSIVHTYAIAHSSLSLLTCHLPTILRPPYRRLDRPRASPTKASRAASAE